MVVWVEVLEALTYPDFHAMGVLVPCRESVEDSVL